MVSTLSSTVLVGFLWLAVSTFDTVNVLPISEADLSPGSLSKAKDEFYKLNLKFNQFRDVVAVFRRDVVNLISRCEKLERELDYLNLLLSLAGINKASMKIPLTSTKGAVSSFHNGFVPANNPFQTHIHYHYYPSQVHNYFTNYLPKGSPAIDQHKGYANLFDQGQNDAQFQATLSELGARDKQVPKPFVRFGPTQTVTPKVDRSSSVVSRETENPTESKATNNVPDENVTLLTPEFNAGNDIYESTTVTPVLTLPPSQPTKDKYTTLVLPPLVTVLSTAMPQPETKSKVTNSSPQFEPFDVEDMILASCHMRANRHIALLNQQDIQGSIKLWQRRSDPNSPLFMQVRLKGFKVMQDCLHNSGGVCGRRSHNTNLTQTNSSETDETQRQTQTYRFGMHVHESSDFSRDCQSTGNHYNPFGVPHGGPNDPVKHVGDLGNISCDQGGRSHEDLMFKHVSLFGPHSILNRAIVIRNQPDDLGKNQNNAASKTMGNSGVRIACCVIREIVDTNNFGDFVD